MDARIAAILAIVVASCLAGAAAWFVFAAAESDLGPTEADREALVASGGTASAASDQDQPEKTGRLDDLVREREEARVARDDLAEKLGAAEVERTRLSDEVIELKDKLSTAEAEVEELRAAKPEPKAEPAVKSNLRVEFGKWAKMKEVAEADWPELGGAINDMQPLLKEFMQATRKGEIPDPVTVKKFGELNKKLIAYVVRVLGKIPTHSGVNGEFTHAINTANLMAAQLEIAGKPLTAEQNKRFVELGEEYERRWDRYQKSYDDDTYDLQKKLDEAGLKQWFVDALFAELTQEQLNTVVDPEVRGLVGLDRYSPGLMLAGQVQPINRKTEEAIKKALLETTKAQLSIELETLEGVGYVFDDWITELREQIGPITAMEAKFMKTIEVIAAGRVQVKIMKRLAELLNLSEEQKQALAAVGTIILPRIVLSD